MNHAGENTIYIITGKALTYNAKPKTIYKGSDLETALVEYRMAVEVERLETVFYWSTTNSGKNKWTDVAETLRAAGFPKAQATTLAEIRAIKAARA